MRNRLTHGGSSSGTQHADACDECLFFLPSAVRVSAPQARSGRKMEAGQSLRPGAWLPQTVDGPAAGPGRKSGTRVST